MGSIISTMSFSMELPDSLAGNFPYFEIDLVYCSLASITISNFLLNVFSNAIQAKKSYGSSFPFPSFLHEGDTYNYK